MLSSKVALITGAAQGIGLATARLLLKNGARVSLSTYAAILGHGQMHVAPPLPSGCFHAHYQKLPLKMHVKALCMVSLDANLVPRSWSVWGGGGEGVSRDEMSRTVCVSASRLQPCFFHQVSMVDLSEQIGKAACAELQRDYSAKDVSFFCTDVTKKEQLVSLALVLLPARGIICYLHVASFATCMWRQLLPVCGIICYLDVASFATCTWHQLLPVCGINCCYLHVASIATCMWHHLLPVPGINCYLYVASIATCMWHHLIPVPGIIYFDTYMWHQLLPVPGIIMWLALP